jgi:hypothetical protein
MTEFGPDVAKTPPRRYVTGSWPRDRGIAGVRPLRRSIAFVIAAFLSASPVAADPASGGTGWGDVSGAELRALLSGNTVTGRHDDGMPYSEWHAPDGRVFGHNNREPVDKGCWDIRGNEVCYYYAGGSIQGEFCWEFRRVTESGFRLRVSNRASFTQATGLLQRGNPHGHTDGGKPWTCEPLQSRRLTPRDGQVRHAAR